MPATNGTKPENIATAVTEVSERVSDARPRGGRAGQGRGAEKVTSILRGTAAVAAGAVFGVFALIFLLETIAWAINAIFISGAGDLWLGFLVVFIILLLLTAAAGLFAWRKLRVGAPTPDMAIDEAKKIRETVTTSAQDGR